MTPIRVETVASLRGALSTSFGLLGWSDHDPPLGREELHRQGLPWAPYVGLVAIDEDAVLASVLVERHPWTGPTGTTRIAGVTGVVTRPDATGQGLATRLLRAVHRREAAAGIGLALLWTRRTWGAHRLYERLGYRDVYSAPSAVRAPRSAAVRRPGPAYRWRRATAGDAAHLERLHGAASEDRFGFTPRYPGSFRLRFVFGRRKPADYHLLFLGPRAVGYFYATEGQWYVTVVEGVLRGRAHAATFLDGIEAFARHRWLGFGSTTLASDLRPELLDRGFDYVSSSHATLMARPLSSTRESSVESVRGVVTDPRFCCHRGDVF